MIYKTVNLWTTPYYYTMYMYEHDDEECMSNLNTHKCTRIAIERLSTPVFAPVVPAVFVPLYLSVARAHTQKKSNVGGRWLRSSYHLVQKPCGQKGRVFYFNLDGEAFFLNVS